MRHRSVRVFESEWNNLHSTPEASPTSSTIRINTARTRGYLGKGIAVLYLSRVGFVEEPRPRNHYRLTSSEAPVQRLRGSPCQS